MFSAPLQPCPSPSAYTTPLVPGASANTTVATQMAGCNSGRLAAVLKVTLPFKVFTIEASCPKYRLALADGEFTVRGITVNFDGVTGAGRGGVKDELEIVGEGDCPATVALLFAPL